MKKFFSLLFFAVFLCFSTISLTSCKNNEIEKVSKDITSYAISATLDDETKQIYSEEKIIFYNNSGVDLDYICLHLYPRAFRENAIIKPYTSLTVASCFPNGISFGDLVVLKVKVNAETKDFELIGEDEDILKINFGFKLTNKKSVEIVIEFNLIIPNSTHRFGWYDGNINLGNWYPIVCETKNGEYDLTPYYSTGDPFFSSIANYDVELTYPEKYNLASTGKFETSVINSAKKSKISGRAVRDFAMCLSDCSTENTIQTNGKVQVKFVSNKQNNSAEKYLNVSKDAVEYFSTTFGNYPYETLTIVETPFIYGGMEYPNLVFISNSIDDETEKLKVIVHEIAHQWWYGVVGNDESKDAWLDESLSEYSTALFFEHNDKYNLTYEDFVNEALSSYLLYVDVIQTLRGEVNTKMNLSVADYQNDYEYSYMVYVKGVIMFDSLKNMVGEKNVIAGLKKYYENNKFKIATYDDFFKAFDSACHKDLKNYFDGFLNGVTIISSIN